MNDKTCDREYSHDDVVAALLELVEEGALEMGVDEDGHSIFWWADERMRNDEVESLAMM